MWEPTRWLKGHVKCLTNEDVPWWELVTPMMNGGTRGTKELAKQLLATWQWTFAVSAADFCLPSLSMLNIGQFLDDVKDHTAWLLAYAQALQSVGEAAEGRRWCPNGMHFSVQVSLLVDTFIIETGAELTEMGIVSCWSQGATTIPLQKKDGPFTNIIAFLDELARCKPSRRMWDELVFPPLLSEEGMPCRSQHLGHILGQIINLGNSLPVFWFQIMELDGKFMGVTRGRSSKGISSCTTPRTMLLSESWCAAQRLIYHPLKTPWCGN